MSKADNTVRETKNNGCLKMMALLLAKNKMDFAGLLFPRVGHSHGALGAWNGFNMSFNFVSLRRIISQPFLSLSLSDNFAQR